jgi:HK97 family phage major capsid protein
MTPEEIKQLGDTLSEKATSAVKEGLADCEKAIDAIKAEQQKQAEEVKVLQSKNVVSVPGLEVEKEKGKDFSFSKAIMGMATHDWSQAGFEKEVLDAARTKALSQGTASAGGYIVPEEYVSDIIELIRANTVLDKVGVTNLTPTSTPVTIPKQAGGATAYWVAENAEITASDQSFGEVNMTPKAVAALTKTSRRLLETSDPSVEAIIRRDLAQVLALAIDIKGLEGTGAGNTPTGVLNQSNILTYANATNGDAVNYQLFQELEGLLEDNNTLGGNLAYIALPKVFRRLKSQKIPQYSGQTDGEYVHGPLVSNAMLEQQLGYSFETTTAIDATGTKGTGTALTSLYFANWQELIKATWGSLTLEASTVAGDSNGGAFTSHQLWIKAVTEVDFGVRHPESFAVATDVDPAYNVDQ